MRKATIGGLDNGPSFVKWLRGCQRQILLTGSAFVPSWPDFLAGTAAGGRVGGEGESTAPRPLPPAAWPVLLGWT